ncbi:hypothetical protein [Clostridium baratii]|uniref:hypothetical protein n=1 Tax=Clostridium baratii TaxID=1561 RepID=UPI0030D0A820
MDIKLKELLNCINTYQEICIRDKSTKESFYPTYRELEGYYECYVRNIEAESQRLSIEIVHGD